MSEELIVQLFLCTLEKWKVSDLGLYHLHRYFCNSYVKKVVKEACSSIKLIYSEKATKFCEIFTLLLTGTTYDKSKVKILQNFVAFSEYMNFTKGQYS